MYGNAIDELLEDIQTNQQKEIYTSKEVADLLKCSTRHIRRLVQQGRFPKPLKLGRLTRWQRGAIDGWINRDSQKIA